ncbi:MAG: hypothetical protein COB08_005235 [Rhodobacteraceae bacterium]|nr:hypothetical protein [Paracoccaceae bacterium]
MPKLIKKTAEEAVTFFGRSPSEVQSAFYKSGLSARGYCIACRIVRQTVQRVDAGGTSRNLFGGRQLYAGTFIRNGNATGGI